MTKEVFAKHTDVFNGLDYEIDKTNSDFPVLKIQKGKKTLKVPAFKSVAYANKKPINVNSVIVYIDKNETFYLPTSLIEIFD